MEVATEGDSEATTTQFQNNEDCPMTTEDQNESDD